MRIMQRRLELQQAADGVDDIINRFQDEPTRFEEILRRPVPGIRLHGDGDDSPARDGGYDIFLERGGMTWIVECKLYGRGHRVGRPVLQKLYGANSGIGADGMIVVTTSGYSADALAYASDTGKIANHRRRPARGQHVPCRMGDTQAAGDPSRRHGHVDPAASYARAIPPTCGSVASFRPREQSAPAEQISIPSETAAKQRILGTLGAFPL